MTTCSSTQITCTHKRTPLTPEQKSQLKKLAMLEREKSEKSPIPIPDKALPEVKAGLPQCFYCALFGHWFRQCPDMRAFLPKTGAPREHWRLLQNGNFYDITVIWPSILDSELGQPSQSSQLTSATSLNDVDGDIEVYSVASSNELFYEAFEEIERAAKAKKDDKLPAAEGLGHPDAEVFARYEASAAAAASKHVARMKKTDGDVLGEGDGLCMTSSSIVVTFASPTFKKGIEMETQTNIGTEDEE